MRLFIAINIPLEIKKKLVDITKELIKFGKVSNVKKANIHITIKFLDEVEDKNIDELKNRLRKIKFNCFNLKLNSFGVFPNINFIKVIWAGLEDSLELRKLHDKVEGALAGLFDKDDKFAEHVTISRVKFVKDRDKLIGFLKKVRFNDKFEVNNFSLIKSELSKDGSKYTVLERYNLE